MTEDLLALAGIIVLLVTLRSGPARDCVGAVGRRSGDLVSAVERAVTEHPARAAAGGVLAVGAVVAVFVGPRVDAGTATYPVQVVTGCGSGGPFAGAGGFWTPSNRSGSYKAVEVSYGWFHRMSSEGVLIGADGSRERATRSKFFLLMCEDSLQ
jgi:hypothetical protein